MRKSDTSARPAANSGEHRRSRSAAAGGGGRRLKILWPALFGSCLAFVGGALAMLWPALKMGGTWLALAMVAAVLALSLTPLLLLRGLLRRVPGSGDGSEKEQIR